MKLRIVEPVAQSLNQGDVFILDPGESNRLFIWNGQESNRLERAKAVEFCAKVKQRERKGNQLNNDFVHSSQAQKLFNWIMILTMKSFGRSFVFLVDIVS